MLTELKSAFCTSAEYKPLYDTELPDGFYKAFCAGISDAVCTFDDMYEFEITFECKPFFYFDSGQNVVVISERNAVIHNPGTVQALPFMEIHGSGSMTCHISGRSFDITGLTDVITIDSDKMLVTKNGVNSADSMHGDYPYLAPGGNNIIFAGGTFAYATIIPGWCRL